MSSKNFEMCFADKGTRCSILTSKNCEGCSFKKTSEQYQKDRLKYRDKEIAYLTRHGITYRGN